MENKIKVGQRVTVAFAAKSVSYGYVRAIEADGTMVVYFPEIKSTGSGWKAYDFNEGR